MTRERLLTAFSDPIPVLDHGLVRLIDVMGDDQAVVKAARVSYDEDSTTHTRGDRGLIRYLMRHQHWSPFEMCEIKVSVRAPIYVARQWVRHRTANWNELSGRYSEMPDLYYLPDTSRIAKQGDTNKQGSGEVFPPGESNYIRANMGAAQQAAHVHYHHMLEEGVAREVARINLPLAQYTQWYWKIDLRNLLHFIHLRMDHHSQYEVQVYAQALWSIVQAWVPLTAEAFEDYVLNALTFHGNELRCLELLLGSDLNSAMMALSSLPSGEQREFREKLRRLQVFLADPVE